MKKGLIWLVVAAGVAAGLLFGTRGEKPQPKAPGASGASQNATAEDAEKLRRSVLAVMVSDLQGPEAPKGARLVQALGLIEGMARRGEIRKTGTPEDMAMIEELKKVQRDGPRDAQEAAGKVLAALR